jgi:glyoxylase-like metal-dependent hydrolase (beta-lactamase superfamily II)
MDEQYLLFAHHDIEGAVIRVLEDELLSVNDFLEPEHHLEFGDEYACAYTCCYVRHRGRHILIDAGFDPDTPAGALESMNVAAEEIELVLLTHADRDHVVGLLMPDGSLTYPHARHVISQALWDNLSQDATLDALDRERSTFYRKLVSVLEDRIQLAAEASEVAEGIRFILSPGHRVGHAVYEFASSGEPLIHSGDAFLHPLFAEHPDWLNVTDSLPEQASESRKRLVEHIVRTGALVLSSHLPFPGLGRVHRDGRAYRWEPASTSR